jgi:hypothetical protein
MRIRRPGSAAPEGSRFVRLFVCVLVCLFVCVFVRRAPERLQVDRRILVERDALFDAEELE